MTSKRSKYEAMRMNPANWKLGIVYFCPHDPRVIVRQRLPVGWTWNFAHPLVFPAITLAVFSFLAPPAIAWWLGVRSGVTLALLAGAALGAIVWAAARLSRDPGA